MNTLEERDMSLIDMKELRKFREADLRARQMVDTSVVHALGEYRGDVDDPRRFAHDVATVATTALLKMIYEEDAELRRLREERDVYKKIAETYAHLQPVPMLIRAKDIAADEI